jgi:8-oxo-dGTP diphosphatase
MTATHSYPYPHPAVATDIAIFTLKAGRLALLLIERGQEPFAGRWALPGGFLREDEDLETCARRELQEETGFDAAMLLHFANFSAPRRDPRERVISVAYLALLPSDNVTLRADSDAAAAEWFDVATLPHLAFDHDEIVRHALVSLRKRAGDFTILLALLPERFTLGALQSAFEAVAGHATDKRNFRKVALASDVIEETEALSRGSHRPARLYRGVRDESAKGSSRR